MYFLLLNYPLFGIILAPLRFVIWERFALGRSKMMKVAKECLRRDLLRFYIEFLGNLLFFAALGAVVGGWLNGTFLVFFFFFMFIYFLLFVFFFNLCVFFFFFFEFIIF
jgi:hypothetical protein